eukprot:GDKI01026814.1.p1 GENE.GDKI01026814.1~~GDKI01026814.1.p1  ORF type:complete len:430 (+),score=158.80 GDKI01026814.1:70-1359(+)
MNSVLNQAAQARYERVQQGGDPTNPPSRQGSTRFNMADNKLAIGCGACVAFLALLFCLLSLGAIEPTEYGITYNTVTNNIDARHVYHGGRHMIGFWNYFITFPATLKTIEFSKYRSSKGATHFPPLKTRTTEGLQVELHISLQYRIIKDELPKLYQVANMRYETLFMQNARDVLLKTASSFPATKYWTDRAHIGDAMLKQCNARLKELHAEAVHLQLLRIDLPDEWEHKIVETQVAQQQIETEGMKQQAARIRAQTNVIQAEFAKNITIINAGAAANSTLLQQTAQAEAFKNTIAAEAAVLKTLATDRLKLTPAQLLKYQQMLAYNNLHNAHFLFGVDRAAVVINSQAGASAAPLSAAARNTLAVAAGLYEEDQQQRPRRMQAAESNGVSMMQLGESHAHTHHTYNTHREEPIAQGSERVHNFGQGLRG